MSKTQQSTTKGNKPSDANPDSKKKGDSKTSQAKGGLNQTGTPTGKAGGKGR